MGGPTPARYARTDDIPDIGTDEYQGALGTLFGVDVQYQRAVDDAKDATEKFGPIDHFVGHSLSGGMATLAALVFNTRATTFNAAGLHSSTAAAFGTTLQNGAALIDAYRVKGDILSTTQDISPAWMGAAAILGPGAFVAGLTGFAMPDSVGTNYWLPASSLDLFRRHKMAQVILGMEEMMKQ